MGVDVDPEVMIGKYFDSEEEAKAYVKDVFGIDEEEYDGTLIELEYTDRSQGLVYGEMSGYSDYGGVLGKPILERHLKYKSDEVDKIWEELYKTFPQEDHEKLVVHIWARYH